MKTTKVPKPKQVHEKQKYMEKLAKALLFFLIIVFFLNACTESVEDGLPGSDSDSSFYHPAGWADNPQHGKDYATDRQNCEACHGENLTGGSSGVSCAPCHHNGFSGSPGACQVCHGDYTDSAHGNTTYGVNRLGTGYPTGACTHCHDTSDPNASENEFMLFVPMNPTSQTDNFCFECHMGSGSVQTDMPQQYSYSYRASGDTHITCPADILEAFSFVDESGSSISNCGSIYGTSHKLTDIKDFIDGRWGYTADSNPCTACHNPHRTQRDPHISSDRGWPVSRPTDHTDTSTWELWGDDLVERMDQYTTYQAPNAASGYEPDGSGTQDGSNLTDYVTFCTDCHNSSNVIYSTVLGRDLYTIGWNTEKHGGGAAGDCGPRLVSPYVDAQCGTYILACTDCHEPHGSPNIFLTRQKVNNGDVTVLTGTGEGPGAMPSASEWAYLCGKCHSGLGTNDGHAHPTRLPWDPDGACSESYCHNVAQEPYYRPCAECHYHRNSSIDARDYGEPLF